MKTYKTVDAKQINEIFARLEKLETAIFSEKSDEIPVPQKEDFPGPKGGVLLLLSTGYLNQCHSAQDVKNELEQNEYHYSIQVIQTALNRLSNTKGPIVSMKKEGKKVYVKRK